MRRTLLLVIGVLLLISVCFGFTACKDSTNDTSYEVKFMVDGVEYDKKTTDDNQSIAFPDEPSKSGYDFNGWYLDTSGKTKLSADSVIDENTTVYAKWTPINYTATFSVNGKSVGTRIFTVEDSAVNNPPSVPSKDGYNGVWEDYEIKAENISINAVYTPIKYTITYSGTDGVVNTNATEYDVETKVDLSDLIRVGYTFDGWYNSSGAKVSELATGTVGNMTLTARWTPIEYTATLYVDGESVGTRTFTVENSTVSNLPSVPEKTGYAGVWENYEIKAENTSINAIYTPIKYTITYSGTEDTTNTNVTEYDIETKVELSDIIRVGYTFDGWYNSYGVKVTEIAVGTVGNVTITARWTPIEYTATLYVDGESVGTRPFTVEDSAVDNLPAVPEKSGYTGTWDIYEIKAENISINAIYTPIKYTITYNGVEDATNSNVTQYDIETNVELLDITRIGYTFDGWYDSNDEKVTEIAIGNIGDMAFTAKWTVNQYTITFDTNSGSEVASVSFDYQATIVMPQKPTKPDNKFVGWFTDAELTIPFDLEVMPANDIKLYAKWDDKFVLDAIVYDETIKAISALKAPTAETFKAYAVDVDGDLVNVEIKVTCSAALTPGSTVIVRLTATANGVTKQESITNVLVYGNPTLEFNSDIQTINLSDELTAELVGASGLDTYSNATSIRVYIEGEYKSGDIVTIKIDSIDVAGNITSGSIKNVKVYGTPTISYNESLVGIKVDDQVNATLFAAKAVDSFGAELDLSVAAQSTIRAGRTVNFKFTTTDAYGNVATITIPVKVYGAPTINAAQKTDFKISDEIMVESLGVTAVDSFGEAINNVTIALKEGENVAGQTMVYTVTATDLLGNVNTRDITVKIYDTPSLTVGKNAIKADDSITIDLFDITAKDSFGNDLVATYELVSGKQTGGTYMQYKFVATDVAGNEIVVPCQIAVYDKDDIAIAYTYCNAIKDTSKGEEFKVSSIDSFGEKCEIYIIAAEGTIASGKTINLYIVAKDKVGNESKNLVESVSIYGTPHINCASDNLIVNADTDVVSLFSVIDSFGLDIDPEIKVVGEQLEGNVLTVSINATDKIGNIVNATYQLAVMSSDCTYIFNADRTGYILTAYSGTAAELALPSYINGIPVISIEKEVFMNNTTLTSLELPETLIGIGEKAFYGCANLATLRLSNYINSIGSNCFYGCKSTLNVYFDGEVADWCKIDFASYNSNPFAITDKVYFNDELLTTLEIPSTIQEIKAYAFYGADFTTVSFGSNVITIGNSAFYNCSKLTAVYYSGNLSYWSSIDFYNNYANPLTYAKNLYKNNTLVTSVSISGDVSDYAFYGCNSIKSVSVSGNIGAYAFYGCTGINSKVSVSGNTGEYAFYGCSSIPSVSISGYIGNSAFSRCTSLTSITFAASTSLGSNAFSGCTGLTSLTLPSTLYSIGSGAFSGCTKLSSVSLNNKEISDYCFQNCSSLKSITISKSITRIGYLAFYGSGLTSVKFAVTTGWKLTSSSGTTSGPYDSTSVLSRSILSNTSNAAMVLTQTDVFIYTDGRGFNGHADSIWTR